MKRFTSIAEGLLGLLALGALVVVLTLTFGGRQKEIDLASQAFHSPIETPTLVPYPPPGTPTPRPSPAPTIPPTFTPTPLPPIAWDPLPSCVNHPQDTTAWLRYVARGTEDTGVVQELAAYLRQARPMSKALQEVDVENLESVLKTPDEAEEREVIRRELTVLWLNVMSGRLNRATEVRFRALPEVYTVGDLIDELEQTWGKGCPTGSLLAASKQIQTGQGITRSACAHLMYLRWGNMINETTWLGDELIEQSALFRPGDAEFPWIMSRLIPAPNYRWVAIETGAYESGGPVQLFNLGTGKLLNLNRQVVPASELTEGITLRHESANWYVIGWHPDAQHLLLGAEGVGAVFWVDLQNKSYRRITLVDSGGVSDKHLIDISPDGNGFVYVTGFLDSNKDQRIDFYDIRSGSSTALLTLPSGEGNLYFPRFSPTGDSVSYVVETRHPNAEQALYVFDLNTHTNRVLFKGAMDLREPVWSPDGRMIAFYKKNREEQYVSIPSVGRLWFGNIWVVYVPSAEIEQVTFIKGGVAYRPRWAQDGRTLAFITHDGQIGLARVDHPEGIWLAATTSSDWPLFTSMFFLP